MKDHTLTRTLTFQCVVRKGMGKHSKMVVPGHHQLPNAPSDWPERLFPGSLNALVVDGGFPVGFDGLGISPGLKKLDEGAFRPEFVIPEALIMNNSKGDGQVWRANVIVPTANAQCACWAFRRIRSTIKKQIELVAGESLREQLALTDGLQVQVVIHEGSDNIPVNQLLRGDDCSYSCRSRSRAIHSPIPIRIEGNR